MVAKRILEDPEVFAAAPVKVGRILDPLWGLAAAEPDLTVEPEAEPEAEPEVEPEAEPEAEPEVEPEAEPGAEPEVEPEAEPGVEPRVEPEVEPELGPEMKLDSGPEAEPEVEPDREVGLGKQIALSEHLLEDDPEFWSSGLLAPLKDVVDDDRLFGSWRVDNGSVDNVAIDDNVDGLVDSSIGDDGAVGNANSPIVGNLEISRRETLVEIQLDAIVTTGGCNNRASIFLWGRCLDEGAGDGSWGDNGEDCNKFHDG
ncbi:hypothetical protein NEOLI_001022 [Neolecta irregularis DAH-3]|uniref:Uncharacterized protein n=1 Tax=Neolecta irregularis (strain DAH-3) TaxID=1198029 RepID=A0A1U7LGM4_NEOID|nr:hypothetical protein NEOLI_001022 [Neolecta irregularis DAH-3]|eukprot:OLL21805.1 hypothetical protein NEOLI_001022 [Neolecta irregularis DAH-3]